MVHIRDLSTQRRRAQEEDVRRLYILYSFYAGGLLRCSIWKFHFGNDHRLPICKIEKCVTFIQIFSKTEPYYNRTSFRKTRPIYSVGPDDVHQLLLPRAQVTSLSDLQAGTNGNGWQLLCHLSTFEDNLKWL